MKKLGFVLSIAIAMLLFSCTSEPANNDINNTANAKLNEKITIDQSPAKLAKIDSISADLDKTSNIIEQNIKALNESEVELMKEFDLK